MKKTGIYSLPALVLLVFVLAVAGCTKDNSPAKPGVNEVWMQNTAFTPADLTVSVNTTVKWVNMDNMAHTVTSDTAGIFDSGTMNQNDTFSYKFTQAGQFPYHCNLHSNMTAKVIVQ